MKITVKVTKDVQRRAMYCDRMSGDIKSTCEVAIAIRELFPNAQVFAKALSFTGAGVNEYDSKMIWLTTEELPKGMVRVPKKVTTRINQFDENTPIQRLLMPEFSFEIDVPNEVIDQIGIGQCYKVLSESKTLELVM